MSTFKKDTFYGTFEKREIPFGQWEKLSDDLERTWLENGLLLIVGSKSLNEEDRYDDILKESSTAAGYQRQHVFSGCIKDSNSKIIYRTSGNSLEQLKDELSSRN
jgi:hypothetical protein